MVTRRKALGGFLPKRTTTEMNLAPETEVFDEFYASNEREQSTTMIL